MNESIVTFLKMLSSKVMICFRYNLKRKAAEMPPLPLEAFLAKMSTHEEQMKVFMQSFSDDQNIISMRLCETRAGHQKDPGYLFTQPLIEKDMLL